MDLTPRQYRVLEAIKILSPLGRYLARDKDGDLWCYAELPTRNKTMWLGGTAYKVNMYHFPLITWDTEPFSIDELLIDSGCDFCKNADFSTFGIYNDRVSLAAGNSKFDEDEQFQFCPECGKELRQGNHHV